MNEFEAFYRSELPKLAGEFYFDPYGKIRDFDGRCPLCALAHSPDFPARTAAGIALGVLNLGKFRYSPEVSAFLRAADGQCRNVKDNQIRAWMIRALELNATGPFPGSDTDYSVAEE